MAFWSRIFSRKSPSSTINSPRRGFLSRGSVRVNEDSAMQVSAFNRGLIYISTQVAKLPWNIKDKDFNILEGDISNLLNLAPNPEMNAFTFRLFMIQNCIIHGNAYAEIERNGIGQPIAIWPLRSLDVEPIRSTSGNLAYRVRVSDASTGNEAVILPPRDVFHLKNFHTKDGIIGQGVVAYGSETLGITLAADQMASGIFHNGGIPSGILKHPGRISDEAYKRLLDSWQANQGGKKSGGTSILEEGISYESINVAPDVLQFLESRQFGVLEIARFLGVPPTKLFDITAATYSNVENANLEVATDTLDSWAVNLEMEADVKLLNNRYGGRFTELDLYAVFRGDMATRANYFKDMLQSGAMTPNQIRQREGLSGYPEGDKYFIATNNFTPVDRLDEVIDSQIKSKNPPQAPAKESTPNPQSDPQLTNAVIEFLKK